MPWTTHGHWYGSSREPTPEDLRNRPDLVSRCGGPGLCGVCSKEAAGPKPSMHQDQVNSILSGEVPRPSISAAMFAAAQALGQEGNRFRTKHKNEDKPAVSMDLDSDEVGVWDTEQDCWVMDPVMSGEDADMHARLINVDHYQRRFGEKLIEVQSQILQQIKICEVWFSQLDKLINWAQTQGYPGP